MSFYSESKQAALHCYDCLSKLYKFTAYLQRLSIQTSEPVALEEALKRVHSIQEEYMESFGRTEIYLQGSPLMTLIDKTESAVLGFKMACTMMAMNVQMKGQNLKRAEAEGNESVAAIWNNEVHRVREHFIAEIEQSEKKYHEFNQSLKKELHKLILDPTYK